MDKTSGFKETKRKTEKRKNIKVRVKNWNEIYEPSTKQEVSDQASRCMDCGVPFCINGCPSPNLLAEFVQPLVKLHVHYQLTKILYL